jgi:hypothetical protein
MALNESKGSKSLEGAISAMADKQLKRVFGGGKLTIEQS